MGIHCFIWPYRTQHEPAVTNPYPYASLLARVLGKWKHLPPKLSPNLDNNKNGNVTQRSSARPPYPPTLPPSRPFAYNTTNLLDTHTIVRLCFLLLTCGWESSSVHEAEMETQYYTSRD